MIGADALSRYVDWTDRGSCILFGDAAGAVLLQVITPFHIVIFLMFSNVSKIPTPITHCVGLAGKSYFYIACEIIFFSSDMMMLFSFCSRVIVKKTVYLLSTCTVMVKVRGK